MESTVFAGVFIPTPAKVLPGDVLMFADEPLVELDLLISILLLLLCSLVEWDVDASHSNVVPVWEPEDVQGRNVLPILLSHRLTGFIRIETERVEHALIFLYCYLRHVWRIVVVASNCLLGQFALHPRWMFFIHGFFAC